MKKITLTLLLATSVLISEAQWSTNLNSGTDLKLGTMNSASLDFYTGSVNYMNLNTDGTLKLRSYTGTGSSPLYVNSDGTLARAPGMGAPNAPCVDGAFPWTMGGNSYPADNTIGTCTNQDFILKANTVQSVFLKISGNVGIGVNNSNPQAMLDVSNNTYTNTNTEHIRIYGDLNGSIESTTQMNLFFKTGTTFALREGSAASGTPLTRFSISGGNVNVANGLNVGGKTIIGNQTQVAPSTYTNALLTVKGTIVGKEMVVTQQNWADYVFNSNYKLQSLESLEKYISQNKHLPNVPSAAEIEKDGANLGEISKIQMEKIEELTLYVIELKKEMEALKKQINSK